MNVNRCDALCILPSRLTTVVSFKYLYKMFFVKRFEPIDMEFTSRILLKDVQTTKHFQKILTDVYDGVNLESIDFFFLLSYIFAVGKVNDLKIRFP
jgi:hypothetical protein